jgi:NAD(P)-dependent dehydrogenase (short-subunit alcohol dehydrogenase family)
MQGKTVVITGGTSGIGRVAAEALAGAGAKIVLIARDRDRAEATLRRLRGVNREADHASYIADLSRLNEMKRVGAQIADAEPRIDVLINNAGAVFEQLDVTEDGFERTFATNHLAYFVLADALKQSLKAAAPARMVMTASVAHRSATLDWSDPQYKRRYSAFGAYCRSKLYNILFTRAMARRLEGTGVTANCFHPGFVATRIGDNTSGAFRLLAGLAKSAFAISPEKGAQTLLHLARSRAAAPVTGGYFVRSAQARPSAIARDDATAARLWDLTAELTGVGREV